jgi:ABC-2 type transport system ATP-binding protein
VLRLIDLHKRFGDITALDGAELTARPGRILGFLGPNGAGKTTAMRAVFGLVALDAGTVLWNDTPVQASDRTGFGYMPEHRGLYPRMQVLRQIAWLGRIRGMPKAEAHEAAADWLGRLGLGDRTSDRVEQLSHGNQQRAQLAACLVHGPDLLVLDEPFSGLDPMGVDSMAEIIRRRADEGAAVVFSSHQLDLVEDVCDDVAIIDHGRMVVSGGIDEVRSGSPHRRVEVGFTDPASEWRPDGESIRVGSRPGFFTFLVSRDSDPADHLASAQRAGHLRSFSFEAPRLSDVFRAAVMR